ncbi:hypothetical protein [Neolewinella antarctica]|uniref:Aminoglycoside phosphotransferase domain-containing protein n=1 Tax=Neolewinella antarctica TaxID=442734 RepID=A0ABX0X997_9BACT|nr:hypothetical protein [Neolewinella antarctica]NJC25595.1 hypothetical protein [Neolewinella antarctica]
MNRQQLNLLRKNPDLKNAELIETHISWLLLTPHKVYKMKKDVQFSFLDFSTLDKRKFYCERELKLNRRTAPDMYEAVVAVNPIGGGLEFGAYQDNSIDYAIRMRRVDKRWEMAGMLERGEVTTAHIDRLADQLAAFHQHATMDKSLFNPIKALDAFSDIGNYVELFNAQIGPAKTDRIMSSIRIARTFLHKHRQRFHCRRILGFTVEGHGDLHASNVFLEHGQPILFDCIEFNDAFRKIDVLDEVAFLCVDLEAAGRADLSERFATSYQSANRSLLTEEDEQMFNYYKCYRASVRLKVTAIKLDHLPGEAHAGKLLCQLRRYREIYHRYVSKLQTYAHEPLAHV